MVIGVGDCTAFVGVAMHCTLVYRLCVIERLKWEESHANAADRDDRVESVRNRVYSIIYRCSISMQFVGVQVFLLRVNRACKTNTSVTVHHNLDEPLETAVVEQSGLRVVHCSSLTGLAVRLVVRGLLVPRWSAVGLAVRLVAPASLVHRWSICWSGCCSVARASLVHLLVHLLVWLFLCHSCIARLSAGPSVRVMIAGSSLLHRWVGECGTIGRRGCSSGVAGEGVVKACSMESNGGSERKTACWRKGKRCWHVRKDCLLQKGTGD